jgi:DNA-directed RNA polymerase specialized sigma24 family protein
MNLSTSGMSRARITAMLSDPDFVESIERTLSKQGIPRRDVPDLVQEAFMAAFVSERLPESDDDARQYVFGIVRNKARMLQRKKRIRGEVAFDEELYDGRDRGPSDHGPAEERDLLEKVTAFVPDSRWQSFMWFQRVTFGESLADVARAEGVDYATAHARVARLRVDLRRWVTQVGVAVAALLVVFAAFRLLRPRPEPQIAPDNGPYRAPPVPPSRPAGPTEEDLDDARDFRQKAVDDCGRQLWMECQRDLEEAKRFDPAGDADPRVVALRKQLQKVKASQFPDKPVPDKPKFP